MCGARDRRQRVPEVIAILCSAGHIRDILMPQLVADVAEASGRTIQDLHCARAINRRAADVFVGHTYSHVGIAIAIEVAGSQGAAKFIVSLRGLLDAGRILVPDLISGGGQS